MTKKGIRAFVVLVFLVFLLTGAGKGIIFEDESSNDAMESKVKETESIIGDTEEEVTEYGGNIPFSEYDCLNEYDLIRGEYLSPTTKELQKMGMCLCSEELKGEFTPVIPEDCSFPEELVVIMEDIFYNSANYFLRDKEDSYAKEKLRELGSEKFKIEQKEERDRVKKLWTDNELLLEQCIDVYHFKLTEETENYMFVNYFVSSSLEVGDVYLVEMEGDRPVERNHFEIESYGGELIQYGGEFYFITWEENDSLGITEGIRIHRLNGNPEEETLCIRYLPDEYIWSGSDMYVGNTDDTPAVYTEKCEYVEKLEKEFVHGRYLRGEEDDFVRTEIYYGDEKNFESLELNDYGTMGFKVDIANCGLPVYVRKDMRQESPRFYDILKVRFFYYHPIKNEFMELDEMSDSAKQLWFKEIGGKVYTCRMDHICDFNYIFNMVLLEKDGEEVDSTVVYSATVVPLRKFVVTEEPVNVTRRQG